MKILILGSNGQLGRELARARWPSGTILESYDRDIVDITSVDSIEAILNAGSPDLIVNAAAYTAVDKAEREAELAFAVNATGPRLLAEAAVIRKAALIHISTDYVFDGNKPDLYREEDPVSPISVYGSTKNDGEVAVRGTLARHLILRTSWVYSVFGNNFVKTMLRLASERPEVHVIADQVGAPTAAIDLAACIVAMAPAAVAGDAAYGTYHVTNMGATTWYGFAQEIFADRERRGQGSVKLTPIRTEDYPTLARRPANSRLDGNLLRQRFGIQMPSWQNGLARVLDELHRGPL